MHVFFLLTFFFISCLCDVITFLDLPLPVSLWCTPHFFKFHCDVLLTLPVPLKRVSWFCIMIYSWVFFPHCHCEVLLVFTSFYDIEAEGPVQEIYFASESQSGSLSLRSVQEPLRCDVCIDNMYTWVWNALVMVGRTTEKNQESYLVLSSPCILRYG